MRQPPPSCNPIAILATVLALAGCATGGDKYPSLAERPAERITGTPAPEDGQTPGPPPSPQAAPSPAEPVPSNLAARLDELVKQARDAHQDFTAGQAAAERLVSAAGAAPAGSESWSQATQALSALEADRGQTAAPLADLDKIDIDDRVAHAQADGTSLGGAPRPAMTAIAQARDTVSTWVEEEDAVLSGLDGRLAR
jgi:hypothetical protein